MRLFTYDKRILTGSQLKRLNEHQYAHKDCSLLDPYLQVWWNWLVRILPDWLAPNLITIIGLLINILTTLILISYSPDAKSTPPQWTCLLCAVGLFVYQSLDAIDGKQARRTNSSSPLGELFDHGCDSISTIVVAISACVSIRLGLQPAWMFYQCFCAIFMFYCAHWQTYVCGVLKFGRIDVTEAQFTIMSILLISAVFGPEIWSVQLFSGYFEFWYVVPISTMAAMSNYFLETFRIIRNEGIGKNGSTVALPFLDCEMATIPLISAVLVALIMARAYFVTIFTGGIGKNGSTVAGTSVLSPIIPISLVLVPAFIIYQKSTEQIFEQQPILYVMAFGIVAAKITNKLVIAHMTKNELEYLDWSLAGPAMLFLNQYFNTFFTEYYVLWLCFVWVLIDFICYSNQVCTQICAFLHIRLFTIAYERNGSVDNTNGQTNGVGGPNTSNGSSSSSVAIGSPGAMRQTRLRTKKLNASIELGAR